MAYEGTADREISLAKTQWESAITTGGRPSDEKSDPTVAFSNGAASGPADQMTCAEASGCGCCEANMAAGATIGPATAAAPWKINSLRFRIVHLF